MIDSAEALFVALAGRRALMPPPRRLLLPIFVDATVNPGDDDDDDEDDDDKGKSGGNIDPDDDEGYGDEDDDDDEEPLRVASMASASPCRMLRRTIHAFHSARPSRMPWRITGPVRVRSQRRHTARSHWRATIGN